MSNRRKSTQPVRPALLSALDVEHERAVKAKNHTRAAELASIIDALQKVLAPQPIVFTAPPMLPEPIVIPTAPPEPEPEPLPLAPDTSELRQLLARADEAFQANEQGERKRLARERVKEAVAGVNRVTDDDQFRYELALMVVNENLEAMADLKAAAAAAGLPVKDYAKRSIAIHTARRRRAAQIYAIEEQALKNIEAATGDAIEAIASKAVEDIWG
jgi:hypothetical protein